MKIRKVDDKPMVIHTKEKAKIHAHEPKGAKIKGSNIYTVERGPKTAGAKVTDTDRKKSYRKSTIHQSEPKNKGLSRFKQNLKESNTSIKTKNTNLHIAGRTGALVAGAVTDQVEGGQEVSQAAYLAYEASRPVTGTASKGAALFRKKAAAEAKKRIKKVEAGKKLAKKTAKKAAKDTAKTVAKETAIGGKVTNAAMLLLGNSDFDYLFTAAPSIMWRLYGVDGTDKDYAIFKIPFINVVDKVFAKVRNLTYRYMPNQMMLFPMETEQYDSWLMRELLNNSIAHSNYQLGGRIYVNEFDDKIKITNPGDFIPQRIENVLEVSYNPPFYRNQLLAEAMVAFHMIDTATLGIRRAYNIQKAKYFPMPDSLSEVQKKNKIHNLLTSMKNKNLIEKDSDNQQKSNWVLK